MALRISRSRTYGARLPLDIARAKGSWLYTRDGRRILDCLSSAGALSLGHNHPVVLAALAHQRDAEVPTLALDFETAPLRSFLEEMERALPDALRADAVVHLCPPSGAVAVEAAISLAEMATGRSGVVAFDGGFHGCTRLARSVSTAGDLALHGLTAVAGTTVAPYPDVDTGYGGLGQPLADQFATATVRSLLGLDSPQRATPAALIIECVQGEAGGTAVSPAFLRAVRAACNEASVVFIADEVQAGVGRTGTMWSFDPAGICPDIIVTSKGLGGGVPVAAVIARGDLDTWPPGAFSGTFRGTTDGYAAAAATLRYLRESGLVAQASRKAAFFRATLEALAADFPAVAAIRGRGMLLGVQLRADGGRGSAAALTVRVQRELLARGVLAEIGGRADDIIRFLPPLTVRDEELALAGSALRASLMAMTGATLLAS